MKHAKKSRTAAHLPALIFLFSLLIAWQIGANRLNAAYILPSPTQIFENTIEEIGDVSFVIFRRFEDDLP